MQTIIEKKYGTTHALWFKASRSFLLLEQPAYRVFQLLNEGKDLETITEICEMELDHLDDNIPQFVKEIYDHIQYYSQSENAENLSQKDRVTLTETSHKDGEICTYLVNQTILSILYGNQQIKHTIHPIIAHLECSVQNNPTDHLQLYQEKEVYVLQHNDTIVEAYSADRMEYFSGAVKQLLISILYNRDFYDWMAMLHASGVVSGEGSILFSAASGSGKSTMAALLKAQGYGYLSDDFIAADNKGFAYAFPDAISVKEGSIPTLLPYYPELGELTSTETWIGKTVRYLPVNKNVNRGVKVKAFVFVQYAPGVQLSFESTDKKTALQLLLKETWVNPKKETVEAFFNWVDNTPFYHLSYSESNDAINVIEKLFKEG